MHEDLMSKQIDGAVWAQLPQPSLEDDMSVVTAKRIESLTRTLDQMYCKIQVLNGECEKVEITLQNTKKFFAENFDDELPELEFERKISEIMVPDSGASYGNLPGKSLFSDDPYKYGETFDEMRERELEVKTKQAREDPRLDLQPQQEPLD